MYQQNGNDSGYVSRREGRSTPLTCLISAAAVLFAFIIMAKAFGANGQGPAEPP